MTDFPKEAFDRWVTTEPQWKCEECGTLDECKEDCECSDCLDNHDNDCLCQGCTDRRCDAAEAMNDLD